MKFSVILPSLLSDYPGAATGRDTKLIRAIQSVIDQTFQDFELIVIADGCKMTEYLVKKHFEIYLMPDIIDNENEQIERGIKLLSVERKGLFGNAPRNAGIDIAQGDYIIYIDSDDKWEPGHLQFVNDNLNGEDWVYFNDYQWNGKEWFSRPVDVKQYGKCGTSNICHASRLGLRWKYSEAGYGHDFLFIQQLNAYPGKYIGQGEYYVCHFGNGSFGMKDKECKHPADHVRIIEWGKSYYCYKCKKVIIQTNERD